MPARSPVTKQADPPGQFDESWIAAESRGRGRRQDDGRIAVRIVEPKPIFLLRAPPHQRRIHLVRCRERRINMAGDKTDKWGLALKTLDDTDIGADRLTVQPQGFSGWHAHPSPVFVTVTQGSIDWYDDALCAAHHYTVGESFIEPAYRAHNVRNPAAAGGQVAEFIAVVIKPGGFVGPAFRLNRDEPSSCAN